MACANLVAEHAKRAQARRDLQEARRQEAVSAASQLTHALVDHLNVGVAQAYLNQKKLDSEAKQLHSHANAFARNTQQWLNLVDSFNSTLKELGEVESWARALEKDMKTISSSLEYCYKVNRQANAAAISAAAAAPGGNPPPLAE